MSNTTHHTILKKAACPTLTQTGTIEYQISRGSTGVIHISLTGNSGNGYFSRTPQPAQAIIKALQDFEAKYPITSLALKDLYPDTSINSWSFLMACLLEEGLVAKHPDHPRQFKLADPKAFLAGLEKLKPVGKSHSPSRKGKVKATG